MQWPRCHLIVTTTEFQPIFYPFFADKLMSEKDKYKAICDDLDSTFAELTGY